MFVLKKIDLDLVLGHYPQIKKQIIETAEERQRLVKERAEAFAKKKREEEEEANRRMEEMLTESSEDNEDENAESGTKVASMAKFGQQTRSKVKNF